jgi:hypothetical protein
MNVPLSNFKSPADRLQLTNQEIKRIEQKVGMSISEIRNLDPRVLHERKTNRRIK